MTESDLTSHGGSSMNRRGFFSWLLGSSAVALVGAIAYPLTRFVMPPKVPEAEASQVVAGKVGELKPNTGKIFPFGKDPAILIMTADGNYKAFSAICTHLDCTVQFRPDLERIWCACHNGQYDLNGKNVAGPPPAPLVAYNVRVQGDQILVTKA